MARKTTTTKKTSKATTAKAAPAKAAAAEAVDAPEEEVAQLKKPDLLNEVVTRTNLKRRDVKPTVEAALAVLGEALRDGKELNIQPLGKVRIVKSTPKEDGAAVFTLKLRMPKNASAAASTPADGA